MSSTEDENPILAVLPVAAETLATTLGARVRLEPGEVLDGRTNVMRCALITSLADAPATVIIKSAHHPHRPPYDPANVEPGSGAALFLKDWLGIQFLDEACPPGTPPFSPRFYGGDRALGYFLMEDLGGGASLANLLLGDNAERAEAGLLAYAKTLGRMHAATIFEGKRYDALCTSLGLSPEQIDRSVHRLSVDLDQWTQSCATLGVTPAPGTAEDLATLHAALTAPTPFLAYTHGDPCPDNNRMTPDGMRLFDFEHGGFRHALADGVYARVPFPTCWCVNRLPDGLSDRMETAYRAELATTCPEASDDARFQRESMTVWAAWLLRTATMHWGLDKVIEEDQHWGISSVRQRLILRFGLFADASESAGYLTALGETAREVTVRLEALWGEGMEAMPLYAAFR